MNIVAGERPAHGGQEGTAYHGYFRQHQCFPLLVFDGKTKQLVTAVLRPDTSTPATARAILKRIARAVRARWPGVTLEVWADSGLAVSALDDSCEAERIAYTLGLHQGESSPAAGC